MRVIMMDNAIDISKEVADTIIRQINKNSGSVLGFATGASPVETYKRIIEAYKNGEVSLKHITTFNLDEYCGLAKDNRNSYFYFMNENLFKDTDVDMTKVNFLSGEAQDIDAECDRYSKKIKECGGIDIQLLGVGTNGHIGFNEPGEKFHDGPFKVQLAKSTIKSNCKYFGEGETMPDSAMTMGIGDIMRAKKIILIATGKSKAKAVKAMVDGEVTAHCPASILKLHSDVSIYVDRESASLL